MADIPEPHPSMPNLRLRRAAATDVPAVHALVTAAYQHYVPRVGRKPGPMLVGYDAILPLPAHRVWVLEDGHTIVALLHIILKSDHVVVENLAVAPSHQGHKSGGWLMRLAEDEAQRGGVYEMRTYTHELMVENQAIYARLGYEETDRRVEDGFARVFLRKRLGRI